MISENTKPTPIRPKPPYRVGLIGVTGYAHDYFRSLNALVAQGRIVWGAVTIINPDEAKEQIAILDALGVPIYRDYQLMLESEKCALDWVCIPTGIGSHTRMTIECLNLGLQVLVEKPLAPTLQDVAAIQAAERASGVSVAVGFQHKYIKDTWHIKQSLLDGEIGEIQKVDCLGMWPRSQNYYHRNEWSGHLHDGDSWVLDSPLHNGLSHMVNLILFWLGDSLDSRAELTRVSAELYRAKPIEGFDTVRTVGLMESGVEAAIILTHASLHQMDPEILITGSNGTLRWRFCGTHTIASKDQVRTIGSPSQLKVRELMFEGVLDHIAGNTNQLCTTEQAKGTCKWVNAVHDICPIQNIPAQYRDEVVVEEGEIFDVVDDLENYAIRSYYDRCPFREAGAPWAILPHERDVRNYTAFEGKFCEVPEREDPLARASL